jgi:hypothetical protein
MTTDEPPTPPQTSISDFESRLTDLLLTAFADGAEIEGYWRIETAPNSVPDWSVEITRHD